MADVAVIRDFFVALGFKTNESDAKKMQGSLVDTEAKAKLLNKALVGLAAAALVAVAKTAQELDKLYYSSQRIGASASNVQAFGDAISQLGGNSEAAVASLESVSQKIRNSPGYEKMVQGLGVATRDQNGAVRDRVEVLKDLSGTLAKMPHHQANAYASSLGIDEQTMMSMRDGKFIAGIEKYQKMRKEMGMTDELAKSGTDFMVESRELGMAVKGVSEVLLMTAGKALIPFLKLINKGIQTAIHLFSELNPAIKGVLAAGLKFAFLALVFGAFFKSLMMLRTGLTLLMSFLPVLKALRLAFLMSPIGIILALASAIALLWDDYKTWKEGGKSLFDWSKWTEGIDKIINKIKDFIEMIGKIKDKVINFIKKVVDDPVGAIQEVTEAAKDALTNVVKSEPVQNVVQAGKKLGDAVSDEIASIANSDTGKVFVGLGAMVAAKSKEVVESIIDPLSDYPTHQKQDTPKTSDGLAAFAQNQSVPGQTAAKLTDAVNQSLANVAATAKALNQGAKGVVSAQSKKMNDVVFAAMDKYGIIEKNDIIGFLSNIDHETGAGKSLFENMNHSWKSFSALAPNINNVRGWISKHGKNAEKEFAKLKKQDIAEVMYGNRKNLGNNQPGDGWKFRGRGYMQLTGRNNYQNFANTINRQDIMQNPDLIATDTELAALASAWFWKKYSQASKNAIKGDFTKARQISNGGNIGMKTYQAILDKYKKGEGSFKRPDKPTTNTRASVAHPIGGFNTFEPPFGNPEKSQVNSSSSMSASSITIHQSFQTDMNIHGARDPIESANAVKHNQENSLIVMARNAKSLLA